MKSNKFITIILIFVAGFNAIAQDSYRPTRQIIFSIFNTNSLLPGGGDLLITSSVIHPGLDLGVGWTFGKKNRSEWITNAKLGYFYHQLSEHAIQLFGEIGYRRFFCKNRFNLSAQFGAGYLHAIPDLQVFALNQNGVYESTSKGSRPQAMIGLSLIPAYSFRWRNKLDYSIFLGYRFMVQTPFVKSYVPILPYTSLHLGTTISLDQLLKLKSL